MRDKGLKITHPRRSILSTLLEMHGPFTVEEIHKKITKRVCDQATVYRSLALLTEAGIVRRCEFGDGSARYELEGVHGHHHHLVCNQCRRVDVIDDTEVEEIDRFARRRGYTDVTHLLEFFGTCPQCRTGAR